VNEPSELGFWSWGVPPAVPPPVEVPYATGVAPVSVNGPPPAGGTPSSDEV